jgi:hypothetical protein
MKLSFFILLIGLSYNYMFGQNVYFTLQSGAANYQGDLQQKPFTLQQSGAQVSASLSYYVTPNIGFSLQGGVGKIQATDAKSNNQGSRERNLSFANKIKEIGVMAEYQVFDLSKKLWTPYGFIGAVLFNHNPYTTDINGNKVFLEPLRTEGQGLPEYPSRKTYKLTQYAIPLGGGVKINLNNNLTIGYSLGLRKTFTDYLDDVSTTYPDFSTLLNRRGTSATALSFRSYEIPGASPVFPAEGFPRGGTSKNSDWYYFQGITVTVHLYGKDAGILNSQNKYRTRCPSVF